MITCLNLVDREVFDTRLNLVDRDLFDTRLMADGEHAKKHQRIGLRLQFNCPRNVYKSTHFEGK
jgi:hypothetical protein